MRTYASAVVILIASMLFALGICEISFPDSFSWTDILSERIPKIYRYGVWIGVGECFLATLFGLGAWLLSPQFARKAFETIFRLGIGGMFIFASLFKLQDPHGFAVLVAQYQLVPHNLVNAFALVMPVAEFLFGTALIVTPFTRENSFIILLMFFAFILALVSALYRDLGITCGCFAIEGAQDKSETWTALIRDLILLGPTYWLTQIPAKSLWAVWKKQ